MEELIALQALSERKIYANSADSTPLDSCVIGSCNEISII